jgi:hypothetical protein
MEKGIKSEESKIVLFGLSKTLFWDVDVTKLKPRKHAVFIVERVLTRGTWDEFKRTLDYYGKTNVGDFARKICFLDELALNFCVNYFKIPKSKFKCFKNKQLNQLHWNY